MIGPDWFYGVSGTLGAFIAGALMPLFALGISHALVSYYMDWDTTRHEVKRIVFLFCGAAVLAVTAYAIEHLSFGIMGERLTLRVRETMFSGNYDQLIIMSRSASSLFSKPILKHRSYLQKLLSRIDSGFIINCRRISIYAHLCACLPI